MKLELPVYGATCCGDYVALAIQLKGNNDILVVKCDNKSEVWGEKGLYSKFGLIEFDTNNVVLASTPICSKEEHCISYKDVKFETKNISEMRKWFYDHYECFLPQ